MDSNHTNHISRYYPEVNLRTRILARIEAYEARTKLWRNTVFGALSLISTGALVSVSVSFWHALTMSNVGTYLSVAFSQGALLSYWKDILAATTEAFPLMYFIAVIALFVSAVFFIRTWTKRGRVSFRLVLN